LKHKLKNNSMVLNMSDN